MKKITSPSNELIKQLAKLQQKKERSQQGLCSVEGLRAIKTFLEAGHKPTYAFITEDQYSIATTLINPTDLILVTPAVMKKLSSATTPSGFLCIFPIPKPASIKLEPGLVLAQVADPGNMGTLIRTAVSLNKKTIVVVEGVDPWSPKVIQASAGTLAYASIFELSWQELLTAKGNLNLCALVVSGGSEPQKVDLSQLLLVVGSEAHGIPASWLADCQSKVTLPMPGGTESLNAAVAGSVALYLSWFFTK